MLVINSNKFEIAGQSLSMQSTDLPAGAVIKRLFCMVDTVGAAEYAVFHDEEGAVYQVPAAKELAVIAMQVGTAGTAANPEMNVLHASTSSGNSTTSAPTDPKYYGTEDSTYYVLMTFAQASNGGNPVQDRAMAWTIPTGRYPHARADSGKINVTLLAIERPN